MEPDIKYARNGGVHIAYRIIGDGPRDIVLVPGSISHVELLWEVPTNKYLLQRLTSFSRVIVFDKRGQGLSDRVGNQTLEERMSDVSAVMDAAGSRCATLYGWSEGGPMSLKFAATCPDRISALVLYGSFASLKDKPWELPLARFERFLGVLEKRWGQGVMIHLYAPSRVKDEALVQWFGRIERESASPASILALMRGIYQIDVRHLLPSIRVPTLILHRAGDALVPVAAGRDLADRIPGAKYKELPGQDHLVLDYETLDLITKLIEEFSAQHPASPGAGVRKSDQYDPHGRDGSRVADDARVPTANDTNGRRPPSIAPVSSMFRNEGEFWTLAYEGHVVRLKDSKGLRYLARLLAHPYREFHAMTLAARPCDSDEADAARAESHAGIDQLQSVGLGDAGEILDTQAKAAYRQRIEDLTEELERARNIGDEDRELKAEEEIETLTAELARAVGLGGRNRRAASSTERARINVTRTIRISIERIREHQSGLASYLSKTIRTGTFCSYRPDPERHIFWDL